jgi:hypothetical protein
VLKDKQVRSQTLDRVKAETGALRAGGFRPLRFPVTEKEPAARMQQLPACAIVVVNGVWIQNITPGSVMRRLRSPDSAVLEDFGPVVSIDTLFAGDVPRGWL